LQDLKKEKIRRGRGKKENDWTKDTNIHIYIGDYITVKVKVLIIIVCLVGQQTGIQYIAFDSIFIYFGKEKKGEENRIGGDQFFLSMKYVDSVYPYVIQNFSSCVSLSLFIFVSLFIYLTTSTLLRMEFVVDIRYQMYQHGYGMYQ
jgi:hypothetical protein